jgi:hypothetical protein
MVWSACGCVREQGGGGKIKALIILFKMNRTKYKNLTLFYDTPVSYLENSYNFTDGKIFKHLKAVDLKDVNFLQIYAGYNCCQF